MNLAPYSCPFCSIEPSRIIDERESAFVTWDKYPVSPGHALIVPRRHVGSWFSTTRPEQCDLNELLEIAKSRIELTNSPDGYNIGINDGPAAGQTIPHLHIHLIPRYRNDREDPRGGIRLVIPENAKYWP